MQTLGLAEVIDRIPQLIKEQRFGEAESLLYPALDQKPETGALWFYAGVLHAMQGMLAIGLECFKRSQALEPHPSIWANIGGVLRQMLQPELAREVLIRGLDHIGEDPDVLGNLCGSYVNEGDPQTGIEYGERALKVRPDHGSAKFNLALLHLEAGNFARGFDLYAEGAHTHRMRKVYSPDPPLLTPELHEQLRGKGKQIIVHGEQGIGDELMMATMLADASQDYEIIFDCHPRLLSLFDEASWRSTDIAAHPINLRATRKEKPDWPHNAVAKCPIGDLGRLYRRDPESFTWDGPIYYPDEIEVSEMRAHLEKAAKGRKIIGLATRGGTMSTARTYRIISPQTLAPLLSDPRYLFVSFDYEDVTGLGEYISKEYGPGRFVWYPSVTWAWDYIHQASMVAATDAMVTVCQSVAHLSAAMGHPTYVLAPSRPAWRYGVSGKTWQWYPHQNARLLRQIGEDWHPAVSALKEALEARFDFNRHREPLSAGLMECKIPGEAA